jgi:hypothetical protein
MFGYLEPVEYLGNFEWKCLCHKCNNYTIVETQGLKSGDYKSCGCNKKEQFRETMMEKYGEVTSTRINNPRE